MNMLRNFRYDVSIRRATKAVNATLVLSLMLSVIPVTAQAAALQQNVTPGANRSCIVNIVPNTQRHELFMPLLTGSALNNSAPVAPRRLNYQSGKTYTYEWGLTVETQGFTKSDEGTNETSNKALGIDALVDVSIFGQDAAGDYQGQIVIRNATICNSDGINESLVSDEAMHAALAKPMHFVQSPNGIIKAVSHAGDSPAVVTNLQKGVVNALQATLQDGTDSYITQERGGQGTYNAQYMLAAEGNNLRVARSYTQDSFVERIFTGDANVPVSMNDSAELVLDAQKGVFSSIRQAETIAIGNGDNFLAEEADFEGVTTWTEVHTSGALTLKTVTDSGVQAAGSDATYVSADLSATIEENAPQPIDWATINLDEEFAQLDAAVASDPVDEEVMVDQMMYLHSLIEADSGTVVLDKVAARLYQNVGNPALANVYVDLLGMAATPQAQAILAGILGQAQSAQNGVQNAGFDPSTQEQALLTAARFETPSATLLDAIQVMANDANQPLNGMAVTALGATISQMRDEDPAQAEVLVDSLESQLSAATSPDQIELYLNALGNAGSVDSFDQIAGFLPNSEFVQAAGETDDTLQVAALIALRKIPGEEVDSRLVAILNAPESTDLLRMTAAEILEERGVPSDVSIAAVDASYNKTWDKLWGSKRLGVGFPGYVKATTPPQSTGLTATARQDVDGYVWYKKINLVAGTLRTSPDGTQHQKFGAYLEVGNNRYLKSYETKLSCDFTKSDKLIRTTVTFYNSTVKVYVIGLITVTVTFKATGYFSLGYTFKTAMCDPTNRQIKAMIRPAGYVRVVGEGSITLVALRGGVGVQAKILNSSVPVDLTLSYKGTTPSLCVDVRAKTEALSGKIYGYVDAGIEILFIKYWKRIFTGNLITFSTAAKTANLLVKCY